MQWTEGDELFDNFELILADNAELAWENITSNIPDAQRTPQRFDEALEEFYLRYVANDAKDTMCSYLNSKEVKKLMKSTTKDHTNHLQTLIRYTNKLPGNTRDIDDNDEKAILFKSFPNNWQRDYIKSARVYANDDCAGIIAYMVNAKAFADAEHATSKKRSKDNNNNNYTDNNFTHIPGGFARENMWYSMFLLFDLCYPSSSIKILIINPSEYSLDARSSFSITFKLNS